MGHVGGRRFAVGELHAAYKTSSANGSHLNVWGFDISAAEFPQQTKTRVFGVNRPLACSSDTWYSANHVYLHRPNAFGFWQMRLHLCYETLKRISNFSELA